MLRMSTNYNYDEVKNNASSALNGQLGPNRVLTHSLAYNQCHGNFYWNVLSAGFVNRDLDFWLRCWDPHGRPTYNM